jgi:O-antigen/teichoic acid export membrane protein
MEYHVYAEDLTFSISRFGLTVVFLALGFGVAGAMAAYVLAWVLEIILLVLFLNHLFPLRRPLNPAERDWRKLLTYSTPLCLNTVMGRLGGSIELFMLGLLGSLASAGIFTAADRLQSVGGRLRLATARAASPIIAELHHRDERAQLEQLYQAVTRWSISFLVPFSLTCIVFAAPLLSIFGEEFQDGVPVLVIFSIGSIFSAATGVTSTMIVMTGHSKLSLANTVLALTSTAILSLLLIPRWGLIGAAFAGVISSGVMSLIRLFEVYGLLRLWPYNRMLIKPVVASGVALCVGLGADQVFPADNGLPYLILDIILVGLAYVATTLVLGLTPEDRMILSRTKRRFMTMVALR